MFTMINNAVPARILITVILALTTAGCYKGSQKMCYELHFRADSASQLSKGSPVVFDYFGIVGHVNEVIKSEGSYVANFCAPSITRIPKNSKVFVGYIKRFEVVGIMVEASKDSGFVSDGEMIQGIAKDSIDYFFPATDTALVNKASEVLKDMAERNKARSRDSAERN